MVSVGDVEMWLEDWLPHLDITAEGTYIIVRAKQYLGKETFNKVLATVRQHGGEYISAGKESHFRVSASGQDNPAKLSLACPHCGKPVTLEKA